MAMAPPSQSNGARFAPIYRPPSHARAVLIRTSRPGRRNRYHVGARLRDGPLLLPEACNLDQAILVEEMPGPIPTTVDGWPEGSACRRCFPDQPVG